MNVCTRTGPDSLTTWMMGSGSPFDISGSPQCNSVG
jgi:hypothetical protein